jgi:hypothetical protein
MLYKVTDLVFGSKYSEDDNGYIHRLSINKLNLHWNENQIKSVGAALNVEISSGTYRMFYFIFLFI